jgi:hypothetical protein
MTMTNLRFLIATACSDYFAMLRRDDYVVDGVNPQEVADIALLAMDFDAWIRYGIEQGWCGPPCCVPLDGIGIPASEEGEYNDGCDPCYHALRLYADADTKAAVEANHSPSVWRATNLA